MKCTARTCHHVRNLKNLKSMATGDRMAHGLSVLLHVMAASVYEEENVTIRFHKMVA